MEVGVRGYQEGVGNKAAEGEWMHILVLTLSR